MTEKVTQHPGSALHHLTAQRPHSAFPLVPRAVLGVGRADLNKTHTCSQDVDPNTTARTATLQRDGTLIKHEVSPTGSPLCLSSVPADV